jgi:signal transduction histidine kinase
LNDASRACERRITTSPAAVGLSERQWAALDVAAALLGFFATALYLRSARGPRGPEVLPLVLLACAPIALRRRFPMTVLVVVTVAIAFLLYRGRSPLPLGVMLGLSGYSVAARFPRRYSIPALVGSGVILGAALATTAWRGVLGGDEIQSFLFLGASWFVGDSVKARHAYVAGLVTQAEERKITEAERAGQAIRDERVRIARELHDVVAHGLTVITVQAGVGRRLMALQPDQAVAALESIEATGRTAQDELRVMLGLLRDDHEHIESMPAPAPGLNELRELIETVRAAGTPVELRMSGTDRRLSPALELSVYRIIQEALTNVVKHAPGRCANVDFAISAREICIEVTDDGAVSSDRTATVSPVAAARRGSPHGIVGMRERVAAFGGSLVAEAVPGQGFRVFARIPMRGGQ